MPTKTLQFENPRFLQSLFANDVGLLKRLQEVVDVKLTTRDGWVRLEGEAEAVRRAEQVFRHLENARRKGLDISPQTFHYVVESSAGAEEEPSLADLAEVQILAPPSRRPVVPKTAGQLRYVEAMLKHEVVFGIGPAGTGKTFLAVASALQALKNKRVERIVLARPAVEAGEALGFLPGDLKDKVFPYLRPLYDAISEMVSPAEVERWMEREIIEIAPLAYMRGRTLNRAFIILDEAQNTTREQMFMFLTRMGEHSRCVVTGDPTQTDLRRGVSSGLREAMQVLGGVEGVEFCHLEQRDVVRHPVVQRIIRAYETHRREPGEPVAGAEVAR
ncbi:MAG: PhoH family protein [Verrucomicrobia bacterium]|nr:PhoH family protein [Verrucomicrobiota bacterium]